MPRDYEDHFLLPSSLMVSIAPIRIHTILGSCVSVCLYDPVSRLAGINHFMLPKWNGEGDRSPAFGDIAIEQLIRRMADKGIPAQTLHAKVFGGAAQHQHESHMNIGTKNYELALALLKKERIKVYASSVGGHFGRKIVFDTGTGSVYMKYINV